MSGLYTEAVMRSIDHDNDHECKRTGVPMAGEQDPINQPTFNPFTKREPNPATIEEIKQIADQYHTALGVARQLREQLDSKLKTAKDAGHSWAQLRDASGFSIATIQAIVKKLEET
jgi:hypothetical protein